MIGAVLRLIIINHKKLTNPRVVLRVGSHLPWMDGIMITIITAKINVRTAIITIAMITVIVTVLIIVTTMMIIIVTVCY